MYATTQICRPLRRGQTRGGVSVGDTAAQSPLAWEGWVAQPVDRSQDFNERVPTSGHLEGTALLCLLLLLVWDPVNARYE